MKIPEAVKNLTFYSYAARCYDIYNKKFAHSHDWYGFIKILLKIQFIKSSEKDELKRKADFFNKLCIKSRIEFEISETFLYSLDPLTCTIPKNYSYATIGNLTVDYSRILSKGIIGLQKEIKAKINSENLKKSDKTFLKYLSEVLESIIVLRNRQLQHLEKVRNGNPENHHIKNLVEIFKQVPLHPAQTFQEALQSFLFINSLIWMDGGYLVGLGRLDQLFYPFLKKDLDNGLKIEEANDLIKGFLKSINKYYEYKSNDLLGDTGQVIVLGGKNHDGTDATNQLTFMFMDALKELKLPDPKIVLRVHDGTTEELWETAFKCLEEGLGYPLFSNDEVLINSLTDFGYREEDSYDYTTSACWEPLIQGKSLDQNNLANINFLEPLLRTLKEVENNKENFSDFNNFLISYKEFLEKYVEDIIENLERIKFEPSPILSLLVDDCVENCRDIADGGARYNHFGLLTLGMGNTINSLLNIKRLVFKEKKIKLWSIYPLLLENFRSNKTLKYELLNKGLKYAMDDDSIIDLTNELINTVQATLNGNRNKYGAKYKFGLSSPNYISGSVDYPASFDGRMMGEPFGVHISPINTSNVSYTAISNFASSLSYDQAFNGGVVDIMVEKSFLKTIEENFLNYLKVSFIKGVMQMQINVLNPETLIKARENPEEYPDLIVRVWGFSAYFKDLPDAYKDLIIKRALQYGSQSNQYTTV